MNYTIYKAYNPSGLTYVGSAKDYKNRIACHKYNSKRKKNMCSFKKLLIGYSFSEIKFEIIKICNEKERYINENFYIKKYNACNDAIASQGPIGFKQSKKAIEKSRNTMFSLWSNKRKEMLKSVNSHKTLDFQKMASAASHKKKYDNIPIKKLICKKNNKEIFKFKTLKELGIFFNFKKSRLYKLSKKDFNKVIKNYHIEGATW